MSLVDIFILFKTREQNSVKNCKENQSKKMIFNSSIKTKKESYLGRVQLKIEYFERKRY